jgi:hypothetical protein
MYPPAHPSGPEASNNARKVEPKTKLRSILFFSKSHPVDIPLSPRCRSVVLTRIRLGQWGEAYLIL